MEAFSSATSRAWKLRLASTMTCLILIKDIPLSSGRRAIDAVGMRTVTWVYRPYEILKGIRHCRLLGLSRDRRLSRHSYSRERLLLTEFFKNSLHPSLGDSNLFPFLSLIGDPLSSRINHALSRRKTHSRARRRFFLSIRLSSLSNFSFAFSFRSFVFFCRRCLDN